MRVYIASESFVRERAIARALLSAFKDDDLELLGCNDDAVLAHDKFETEKDAILSSQILVCDVNNNDNSSENVTRAVSLFVGSLETIETLGLKHTPKMVIGIAPRDISNEVINSKSLFNVSAIYSRGTIVFDLDLLITQIADFIDNYPM
jgi:hypothetical protein